MHMATDRIKINPAGGNWVVRAGGAIIAESSNALELREADYPPVIYFPRSDVAMEFVDASEQKSTCPFKGEAFYFHIAAKSGAIKNAVWSYEAPLEGVGEIAGYVAFYADKVTIERL